MKNNITKDLGGKFTGKEDGKSCKEKMNRLIRLMRFNYWYQFTA